MSEKQVLTHSAIQAYKDCPAKYRHRYVDCLDSTAPISTNLSIGSAIHSALELWHGGHDWDAVRDYLLRAPVSGDAYLQCVAMMRGYVKQYPRGSEKFEVICLEKAFSQPIRSPSTGGMSTKYTQEGKVDGVIKLDGEYYLMEHKTAAKADHNYFDKLWIDRQIHQYAHYMGLELGIEIVGVLYNVLAKLKRPRHGLRAKLKSPETDESYLTRLFAAYEDPALFIRQTLPVIERTSDEVIEEVWDVKNLIMASAKDDKYYLNTNSCHKWGRRCRYWELCRSGSDEAVKRELYVPREKHEELIEASATSSFMI